MLVVNCAWSVAVWVTVGVEICVAVVVVFAAKAG